MHNTINIDDIWKKYKSGKYPKLKNDIIEYYYDLVDRIAKKVAAKMNYRVSAEELGSHGVDGLYRAIEAYDLSRGIKFETYAYARIHGSMIDGLRTDDWVPRSVRIRHNILEKAKELARIKLGREPDDIVQALVHACTIRPERYTILSEKKLSLDSATRVAKATGVID